MKWMKDLNINWADVKTTMCGLVAASALFIVTKKPDYIPKPVQDIAGFVCSGGLLAMGISASDSKKNPQ